MAKSSNKTSSDALKVVNFSHDSRVARALAGESGFCRSNMLPDLHSPCWRTSFPTSAITKSIGEDSNGTACLTLIT
jgi:hypothetical protein